ncbi:hypothetical protein ACIRRH_21850 [Kitasatospora sp. NPDC101235]|uniref:hypothetical protein n=1 Tax=Kitasatospora sp. NPDC101235 TaxID=3364101 RepID=UPI00380089F4
MSSRHLSQFRQFNAAARVIGRRNALRYLALGMGASLVAACGGSSGGSTGSGDGKAAAGDAGAPTAAAPGSSDPSAGGAGTSAVPSAPAAKPTVGERIFDAFVTGTWTIESTSTRGDKAHGKITIESGGRNGGWTLVWDDLDGKPATWRGSLLLRGGHLSLSFFEGPKKLMNARPEALQVPDTVGDTVQLTFPWAPPGATAASSKDKLDVSYSNNVLRIAHTSGGKPTTHVCTRV